MTLTFEQIKAKQRWDTLPVLVELQKKYADYADYCRCLMNWCGMQFRVTDAYKNPSMAKIQAYAQVMRDVAALPEFTFLFEYPSVMSWNNYTFTSVFAFTFSPEFYKSEKYLALPKEEQDLLFGTVMFQVDTKKHKRLYIAQTGQVLLDVDADMYATKLIRTAHWLPFLFKYNSGKK